MKEVFPAWTAMPFVVLVLGIASLPLVIPDFWGKLWFQASVACVCALPVILFLTLGGHVEHLTSVLGSYVSFVTTIGALYVTTSGIFVSGDIEATPRVNLTFLAIGAGLASVIGTTGASVLMIRPLLRTNRQRANRGHLVPFFIVIVANVGGMLTPLGDPPLLLGYIEGVPFLWTLRLLPYWVLYVGAGLAAFWFVERRAHLAEPEAAKEKDLAQVVPIGVSGKHNLLLLVGIVVGVMLLPSPIREVAMVVIGAASYELTSDGVRESNGFSFAPIVEVAVLFAGLFVCLAPVEVQLAESAPTLPLRHASQLFWGSGLLSSVLDSAPTYEAFMALARGLSHGLPDLVAGVSPVQLVAISVGSVVMGATTYIGNGPNLVVKAIAEQADYSTPSFVRYAFFAISVMLPLHVITTVALMMMER